MFGVELIAAVIGLAAIALAYFVFNYSLREKTFEEALAEQRGDSADAGKGQKKDKTKKLKKKVSVPSDSDASPKTVSPRLSASADTVPKDKFAAMKQREGKIRKLSESASAEDVNIKPISPKKVEAQIVVPVPLSRPSDSEGEKEQKKPISQPKPKKETGKRISESRGEGDHVLEKENRAEKITAPESGRKPNLVQLELAQHGHFDALPKTAVKKEMKAEKSSNPVQATVPPKDVPSKKPLTVVSAKNGPQLSNGSEYNEVLGLLKTVQLTDAETQNLLQVLIVKLSERHSEWVNLSKGKSTDPATIAKRLMEDKERELDDERQMNRALVDQLKELKNLANQEKIHLREMTETSRQSTEKATSLEHQLKSVNSRLKDFQDKHFAEVATLNSRIDEGEKRAASLRISEEESRKLQQKTTITTGHDDLRKDLEAIRSERDALIQQVQASQKRVADLEEQHATPRQTETFVRSVPPAETDTRVRDVQLKLEAASQGREDVEKQVADLTLKLSEREAEMENLSRQLEDGESRLSSLQHENSGLSKKFDHLKETVKHEQTAEESNLQKDIETLQRQEWDLREQMKNTRLESEEVKDEYERQITETRDKHRDAIRRAFPGLRLDNSLNSGEWLKQFESEVGKSLQESKRSSQEELGSAENISRQMAELQDVQGSLQAEVEKYRSTLADTERKLRELENSVQTEEEKWELVGQTAKEHEHKWRHLETQLSEVMDEKNTVQKLLAERSSSAGEIEHRLQEAEERIRAFSSVQEQLESLRSEADRMRGDMAETRREKDRLSEEASGLRRNLQDSSRTQNDAELRASTLLQELTELRNKSDSLDTLHQEAVDLRQALDMEKDNARKMAQELLRSRSLIQVGLESLRKEEETVSKLKEALESRENGLNGSGDTAHR